MEQVAPAITAISNKDYDQIMTWAEKKTMSMVTRSLLEIWQADNPAALKQMAAAGKLMVHLRALEENLDMAQDLRADYQNQNLATFEILQMAGVPLHVPTFE